MVHDSHSPWGSSYDILCAFAEPCIVDKRGLSNEVTLIEIQDRLKQQVRAAALELFGIELEQGNAETPPRPELGDVAFPVAFELAKLVKLGTGVKIAPRAIAEQLKTKLEASAEVERVEVAGAGYLNVFFDRARLLSLFAPEKPPPSPESLPYPIDRRKWSNTPALIQTRLRTLGTYETPCWATPLCESFSRPMNALRFRITLTTRVCRLLT